MQAVHLLGHPVGLVPLVLGLVVRDPLAAQALGSQHLGLAHHVVGDDGVGRVQDRLRGAVVLLQQHDRGIREGLLELEDVADVRPSEAVDALVGVSHHEDVAVILAQQQDQLVLGAVDVLVLVHEDVGEAALVLGQHVRVALEQVDRDHEQIVEVHGAGGQEPLLIVAVDLGDPLFLDVHRPGRVGLEVDQLVLGVANGGVHGSRRKALGVEVEVAQHVAGEPHGVGLVVDRERGAVAQLVGVATQDAHAGGVKGRHPHPLGHRADQGGDALAHLVGRLVGEGDGEQPERRHVARRDQVGDASGEHPGLARAGAGDHQQRTVAVQHGATLGRVEPGQQLVLPRPIRPGPGRLAHLVATIPVVTPTRWCREAWT